jgi:hypothetical protein
MPWRAGRPPRNRNEQMETRQQRRAAARRRTGKPPRQSKWRLAAQVALGLLAPLRRLPWWADVLGVLAAVFVFWGVYIDTQPAIEHGSSASSPFIIKNPSIVFDMKDVVLTCQVIGTKWGGVSVPPGAFFVQTLHAKMDGRIISTQRNVKISHSEPANFPCNVEGIQDADINGTPQVLEEMQVGILVKFRTLGFPRSVPSSVFTWKKLADGHYEWLEGPTIR